jgi:hypothetical protein
LKRLARGGPFFVAELAIAVFVEALDELGSHLFTIGTCAARAWSARSTRTRFTSTRFIGAGAILASVTGSRLLRVAGVAVIAMAVTSMAAVGIASVAIVRNMKVPVVTRMSRSGPVRRVREPAPAHGHVRRTVTLTGVVRPMTGGTVRTSPRSMPAVMARHHLGVMPMR